MSPFSLISHVLVSAGDSTSLIALAIIVSTLILEDPTTVFVGVLAADGQVPLMVALLSLYMGIILGDLGLYAVGRLASTHPRLERFVDHDAVVPFRAWLETRFALTVFSARFIPGLRMPTYLGSGFFRTSLRTFFLVGILAVSIWTTLLFSASYLFGDVTSQWLGWVRYGVAAVFILILFFVGRHNLKASRIGKNIS